MCHQQLRHFLRNFLQASQRQLIVFLAVYVVLFGPLLTGWQFGGGRSIKLPAFLPASSEVAPCGQSSDTPSNLFQCNTIPMRGLPRIFAVPGTFFLAVVLIALLLIAHSINLIPLVRLAFPPPLDDPPPRYPPRSL